jgi:hypothetical protein
MHLSRSALGVLALKVDAPVKLLVVAVGVAKAVEFVPSR